MEQITETQLKSVIEHYFTSGGFPVHAHSGSMILLASWIETHFNQIKGLGFKSVARLKRRPKKIDIAKHNFAVFIDLARQLGFTIREVSIDPVHGSSYVLSSEPFYKSFDIPQVKSVKKRNLQQVDPLTELERALSRNQVVFVSGQAGSGKTTLIKAWYEKHQNEGVILTATTGIAAQNLTDRCRTIHSVFRFMGNIIDASTHNGVIGEAICEHFEIHKEKLLFLKKYKTLIIEEASMLRADLLTGVDQLLQLIHKNTKPFGGIQIILCGDMAQLPPVVKADEYDVLKSRYGGVNFFCAPPIKEVMRNNAFCQIKQPTVYRQLGDPTYLDVLSRVRLGKQTQDDLDYLNASRNSNPYSIALSPTNAMVKLINDNHFNSLPGKVHHLEGVLHDPEKRFKTLPVPQNIYLKPGMKILTIRNCSNNTFVNGTIGIFVDHDKGKVEMKTLDNTVYVPQKTFDEFKVSYNRKTDKLMQEIVASYHQYPILPGHAITIHRSQGQTYEHLEYRADRCQRTHGLFYTMLSRCRSRHGLNIKDLIKPSDIYCDTSLLDFI